MVVKVKDRLMIVESNREEIARTLCALPFDQRNAPTLIKKTEPFSHIQDTYKSGSVLTMVDASLLANERVASLCNQMRDCNLGPILALSGGEQVKAIRRYPSNRARIPRDDYSSVLVIGSGSFINFAYFAIADVFLSDSDQQKLDVIVVPCNAMSIADVAVGSLGLMNDGPEKNSLRKYCDPTFVILSENIFNESPLSQRSDGQIEVLKLAMLQNSRLYEDSLLAYLKPESCESKLFQTACRGLEEKVLLQDRILSSGQSEYGIMLNYGHLVAHALESFSNYGVAHSSAVFIGLICEMLLVDQTLAANDLIAMSQESSKYEELRVASRDLISIDLNETVPINSHFRSKGNFRVIQLDEIGEYEGLNVPVRCELFSEEAVVACMHKAHAMLSAGG